MKTGKFNVLFFALSCAGLLFGGYFAVEELFIGPSFATNDSLIWTLPLVSYIFLALTSTGVSILLAFGELTGNQVIKSHKLILLVVALSLLVGAFSALGTELGSILHVFWLLLSPNLKSPIWWMGTLYSIELALLGFKLFILVSEKSFTFDRWLSVGTLVIAVSASLVLGSVFGTVIGRVGFSGIEAPVLTLLCALVSGLVMAQLLIGKEQRESLVLVTRITIAALTVLLSVQYVYSARSSVVDALSWVGLWIPVFLVIAGAVCQKAPRITALITFPTLLLTELAFVIQGQTIVLGPKQTWFGAMQNYQPNMAEIGIFVFGCSVAYLCYTLLYGVVTRKINNV